MHADELKHRTMLENLADQAMIDRGLLPDFSPEAFAELDILQKQAAQTDGQLRSSDSIRDLRHLLWASIDNDDSRDLDQLTVAEALPDGKVKILVAVSDVDSLVKKDLPSMITPATIPPLCTPLPKYSRCCQNSFPPISPP